MAVMEAQMAALAAKRTKSPLLPADAEWPYESHMDGWVIAHDALRYDMDQILLAADTLSKQASGGNALKNWQVNNLKTAWHHFVHHVEVHHGNEEKLLFPWMSSKVKMPPRFSDDHDTLLKQMAACTAAMDQLERSGVAEQDAAMMKAFLDVYTSMKGHMEEHLLEEEVQGLPLLRANFTLKELQVVEDKIVKSMSVAQTAAFFATLQVDRRERFYKQAGIPWLVTRLLLNPGIKKHNRTLGKLLPDIINNTGSDAKPKRGCFKA